MLKALLARIPAVWQALIVALLLLAASVWCNVRQFLALHDAPLREQVASQQEALDASAALLKDARAMSSDLYVAAAHTKTTLQAASSAYDAAMQARPLGAQCAPGAPRQTAVNRSLGAK